MPPTKIIHLPNGASWSSLKIGHSTTSGVTNVSYLPRVMSVVCVGKVGENALEKNVFQQALRSPALTLKCKTVT